MNTLAACFFHLCDARWGSQLSTKLFVARKFVVKHIRTKHDEKLQVEKERVRVLPLFPRPAALSSSCPCFLCLPAVECWLCFAGRFLSSIGLPAACIACQLPRRAALPSLARAAWHQPCIARCYPGTLSAAWLSLHAVRHVAA